MIPIDRPRRLPAAWCAALALACGLAAARAENVDPAGDGHRWAWSENAGWIDAQPLGPGGPGMQVGSAAVTGWLWSENLGWINLHCGNLDTCGDTAFGVTNDGAGHLAGYAWSENAGWIDFHPAGGGVTIAGAPSELAGTAWGENVGWINFSPGEARAIQVAWSSGPSVPYGSPSLSVTHDGATQLAWSALAGASAYDAVRGGLLPLLASGGNYAATGITCVVHDTAARSVSNATTDADPAPGAGYWYLVRGVNATGHGTYAERGLPPAARDSGIAASGSDCP